MVTFCTARKLFVSIYTNKQHRNSFLQSRYFFDLTRISCLVAMLQIKYTYNVKIRVKSTTIFTALRFYKSVRPKSECYLKIILICACVNVSA